MTSVQQYFQALIDEDPKFAQLAAESDAELSLALQTAHLREKRGMTQQELAAAAGMKQPAIARYEKAGRTPTLATLWRLATALNIEFRFGPDYAVTVAPLLGAALHFSTPGGFYGFGAADRLSSLPNHYVFPPVSSGPWADAVELPTVEDSARLLESNEGDSIDLRVRAA